MMKRILAAGASGQQKAQRGAEAPQGAPAIVLVPMIAFGTDWRGEFDSVAADPKATVTIYDNENYREKAATFKPNQKIADLGEKMGFFKDIRSAKIACAGGGKTAQQGGDKRSAAAGGSKQKQQ